MLINPKLIRRTALRGLLGGAAISVALPFLECFLDSHGEARADGRPLPVFFGSWYNSCGFTPGFWEPKSFGANYENNLMLKALDPLKSKITIFSGLRIGLDANPNKPHVTGGEVCLAGGCFKQGLNLASIDMIIADKIGPDTPFRAIDVRCDGSSGSLSRRSASSAGVAETAPERLYATIFGADFKDPNASAFTPDPKLMARKSVLSAVTERRRDLLSQVGASDKARLDEYFSSLRSLENQLAARLEKPAPVVGCKVAATQDYAESKHGTDINDALRDHGLFAKLIAHAVSCDQTRVFNVQLSGGIGSPLRRAGDSHTFHVYTHEEGVDLKLGYQPNVGWFEQQQAKAYADFLTTLDSFKIGNQSLLDRSLVMYSTDCGKAQVHSVENMPLMLAGSAGGRVKTGVHIQAQGQPVTRVGLTAQMALGVVTSEWGTESNRTNKPFSEIMM